MLFKKQKIAFWATLFGLRGNVRTPCIACWRARGRLYVRRNWTFFAITYGWDVISGNLWKSAFFEGGGSLWAQISDKRGRCPPTIVGVRKLEWLPFHVVSKYLQYIVWFCQKARVWQTDRQADGQNYDSQDRASIAASRGKNRLTFVKVMNEYRVTCF